MRGYTQKNLNKQRNRTVPLVHVKFILMHQISHVFTYGRVTLVKEYLIIKVYIRFLLLDILYKNRIHLLSKIETMF